MANCHESFIFNRELQLLTDEYRTAPADLKRFILKDIKLLQTAITLLQGDAC